MQSWTLGFLCYNEEHSIIKVVDCAYETLSKMTPDFEVIVINDGSNDSSLSLIEEYRINKEPNLKIINHGVNKGIGEGLRSGYNEASKDNVLITCGDGQFDIKELLKYKEIEEKTVICFYRRNNTVYDLRRNYLSALNKYLNKYLIGLDLKDVNWAKVYKLSEIKKINLELRSSLLETEICAKLKINNNRFVEVESKYLNRTGGVSKGANLRIVKKAVFELLKLIYVVFKFNLKKK